MPELAIGQRSARFILTGHSGAELTLIEADGHSFVRKQAHSPGQSARLSAQCDKLRLAGAAGIPCPSVLRSGVVDGLFSFDMEYVPADSLAHALIAGHEPDWSTLLPQLVALLEMFRSKSKGTIPRSVFIGKLESIATACRKNIHAAMEHARIAAAVARLRSLNWDDIPESDCHGDFTLENILIRADGHAVIIDFDIPEQNSWWLDIAKLLQDLVGHWCLRHQVLSDPEGVETLNSQLALSRAEARFEPVIDSMIDGGIARLRPLVAFHLLRTLPYARNPLLVEYVLCRIGVVLDAL